MGGFDVAVPAAGDWQFCLRIAAAWRFAVVPRYRILYRISERAMSANAQRSEEAMLRICDQAFKAPSRPLPERGECLANVKQYIAFLYLTRHPGFEVWKKAGQKLAECVCLHPRTLLTRKTWHLLFAWSLLQLLPTRRRRSAVITLLRIYGRWSMLRPDVWQFVDDLKTSGLGMSRGRSGKAV